MNAAIGAGVMPAAAAPQAAGSMGLMRYDFGPPKDHNAETEKTKQLGDNLGQVLHKRWTEWRDARRYKEEEWLEDLLAYHGQYDATTLAKIGPHRSRVFVQLTRVKVNAAYSRIIDVLFSATSQHWDISPTPVPELETGLVLEIPETGEQITLTAEDVQHIAKQAMKGMKAEMKDQLVASDYETHMKSAIKEMCILGNGCMKGITVKTDFTKRWGPNPEAAGTWRIFRERKAFPSLYAPSMWNIYPDPWATSMEDCLGLFERHVLTRDKVRALADFEGFDAERIELAIQAHPNGNHVEETQELERKRIHKNENTTVAHGRYDVLEYWGLVSGADLQAAGLEIKDPTVDYQACVFVLGNYTIKLMLNPAANERIPYHLFAYDNSPHSLLGSGPPRQMRDSQITLNTATRVLLDNMALSSGPQIEVNLDMLAPGQNPRDIMPWGIWYREGGDPLAPMLRVHRLENISAPLVNVIDLMRRFADEETSIPAYSHGMTMPGLNKTASGMSMLMSASNVNLKGVIKNIDDYCIRPLMTGLYDWNMQYNPKREIKGDLSVEAKGSQALMAKEVQSQRILDLLQRTLNPVDMQIMGPERRAELLREGADAMDIHPDKVAPDVDELEAEQNAAAAGGSGAAPNRRGSPGVPPSGGGRPAGMGARPGVPDPATGVVPG